MFAPVRTLPQGGTLEQNLVVWCNHDAAMSELASVIRRFSDHEFMLRRLHATDPEFKILCEDYATAINALDHWKENASRAEEYRQIIAELEEEILCLLRVSRALPRRH